MSSIRKPRYGFCWWCSEKLRGRHHLYMRATTAIPNSDPVVVHHACADEMVEEGGWDLVAANDNAVIHRVDVAERDRST